MSSAAEILKAKQEAAAAKQEAKKGPVVAFKTFRAGGLLLDGKQEMPEAGLFKLRDDDTEQRQKDLISYWQRGFLEPVYQEEPKEEPPEETK